MANSTDTETEVAERIFFYSGPVARVTPFISGYAFAAAFVFVYAARKLYNSPIGSHTVDTKGKKFLALFVCLLQATHFLSAFTASSSLSNHSQDYTFASRDPIPWSLPVMLATTVLNELTSNVAMFLFLRRRITTGWFMRSILLASMTLAASWGLTASLLGHTNTLQNIFNSTPDLRLPSLSQYVSGVVLWSSASTDFLWFTCITTSFPNTFHQYHTGWLIVISLVKHCAALVYQMGDKGSLTVSLFRLFCFEFISNVHIAGVMLLVHSMLKKETDNQYVIKLLQSSTYAQA